jgi:hypothetical protein
MTDSIKRVYRADNNFQIEYSKEEEIRMGLFASQVSVFKDGKNVTSSILDKSFWATIPRPFEPLSFDASFAFLPTCPTYKDPRPIVLNTNNLTMIYLDSPGYISANQFSKDSNFLLLNGYVKLILFKCDTNETKTLYEKNDDQNIEFSFFSTSGDKIFMLLTDHKLREQTVWTFTLTGEHLETNYLKTPEDIFNFEFAKFERLARKDKYNLFNSYGYAFVAAGRMLNKWHFMNYDRATNEISLRSYIPVSDIYYNKEWKQEGCDIRIKEIGLTIAT